MNSPAGWRSFTGNFHKRNFGLAVLICTVGWLAGCAACKTVEAPPAAKGPAPVGKTHQLGQAKAEQWQSLFDGKTLKGWAITDFAGHGDVRVDSSGNIILEMGVMTGVTCTSSIPEMNYEVELDAMRVEGNDFFCGLTFPVGKNPCSFILGGWGGGVVGLSSLDGEDAAHNETTKSMNFDKGRWYRVRVRVTPTAIQAWIDAEKMVDVVTTDRSISIRTEVEASRPLGIASWATTGALRNIRIRPL